MNVIRMAFLLFFILPPAMAAEEECFCLQDADDNFRHSCSTQQQGIRQVVHCLDDAGEPYRVDDLSGWARLAEGEGRCHPCRPVQTRTEGPIRGDKDDAPTPDPADDRAD